MISRDGKIIGPDSTNSFSRGLGSTFGTSLWFPLLILGLGLIALAILLIIHPDLLAFFFAGIMIFIGIGMISSALFLRRKSKQVSIFEI